MQPVKNIVLFTFTETQALELEFIPKPDICDICFIFSITKKLVTAIAQPQKHITSGEIYLFVAFKASKREGK